MGRVTMRGSMRASGRTKPAPSFHDFVEFEARMFDVNIPEGDEVRLFTAHDIAERMRLSVRTVRRDAQMPDCPLRFVLQRTGHKRVCDAATAKRYMLWLLGEPVPPREISSYDFEEWWARRQRSRKKVGLTEATHKAAADRLNRLQFGLPEPPPPPPQGPSSEETREHFAQPVRELDLSRRALLCLASHGVKTIGDLCRPKALPEYVARPVREELVARLKERRLSLEMTVTV
jgi:hypothetical protein